MSTEPTIDPAAVAFSADAAKHDLLLCLSDGSIPADVPSFAALHDHIDANDCGVWTDPTWSAQFPDPPTWFAHVNAAQSIVDAWIVAGGLTRTPTGA